ncbi:alpha/beta hydrolase [Streptomyces sp. PKU-EA00015]|uniref:alpha/beta hydrolase n=1 Tax=Streptomyces sp. PKU-EA00015 TaxID=2748326 RepID=UPI0015A27FE0|nr:alpha/beta hydrolase [Streptomyces sp. PKU-EA00015]NWF30220.1 alpha/beta hydrolase [Streptomyces sp. PKU-EA00015]
MPLHPVVKGIRNFRMATGFTPLYTMSVEEARKADSETEAEIWEWIKRPEEIFDLDIDGPAGPLTLRVYRPEKESDEPLPVLVYFFGGGFVVGSLDTSEAICRALASMVPCVVVSVGYRLAPEHPFPAATEDCYAAVRWVAENASRIGADGERIAVAGDSNGGTLAAAISLMARDADRPRISAQVLIYPAMRHGSVTASMRDNKDPMFFNAHSVPWFWNHYLADPADGASPYASPLNATDHSGLPATLMITAEFCPLRDEGEAYADALSVADVPVEYHRYKDLPHGFMSMTSVLDTAREALDEIVAFLRRRLASDDMEQNRPEH